MTEPLLDPTEIRLALHAVEAELLEIKTRIRHGELLPSADLFRNLETLAMSHRDRMVNIPSRFAARLAAEYGVDDRRLASALAKAIDRMLATIARETQALVDAQAKPDEPT